MVRKTASFSLLILALMMLLALGLAGCKDDEESTATPPNSANARDTTTLQTLADQAATDSGLGSFTAIDATNAGTVASDLDDDVSAISDAVQIDNGVTPQAAAVSRSVLSRSGLALADALIASGVPGADVLATSLPQATQTVTVSGTHTCSDVGTAAVTGTIVVTAPDSNSQTSASVTVDLQNIDLTIDGCHETNGTYTVWGSALMNSTTTFTFTQDSSNSLSFSLSLDQYYDGGFAITDSAVNPTNPTNYNLALSWSVVGTASGTLDSSFNETPTTASFTATLTVNNVTCTATVTDPAVVGGGAAVPWTCTAG